MADSDVVVMLDVALRSGDTALANGNLALAEQGWSYGVSQASLLVSPLTRAMKDGELNVLRARIDTLRANPQETAALVGARTAQVNAVQAERDALEQRQKDTDFAARDQQQLQDLKDYGSVGGLLVGGGRSAADAASSAAKAAGDLVGEYKGTLYALGGLFALGCGTVIVLKVA